MCARSQSALWTQVLDVYRDVQNILQNTCNNIQLFAFLVYDIN